MVLLEISVVILCLSQMTWAHSWVACADYKAEITGRDYSDNLCKGWIRRWIRPWDKTTKTTYGKDRGIHYSPKMGSGQQLCQAPLQGSASNGYSPNYRLDMPRYVAGQTVRLVWPAKNHANYECFGNIQDKSMKLFVNPKVNPTKDLPNTKTTMAGNGWKLVKDWQEGCTPGKPGCGFQNCPKFCMNTGYATCYGDWVVPKVAKSGYYTFAWYWVFTKDLEPLISCFEAYIDVSKNGKNIYPNLPSPGDNDAGKEVDGYLTKLPFCISGGKRSNWWQARDLIKEVFKEYLGFYGHEVEIVITEDNGSKGWKFTAQWMHPTTKTQDIQALAYHVYCKEFEKKFGRWAKCKFCGDIENKAVLKVPTQKPTSQDIAIVSAKNLNSYLWGMDIQNIEQCQSQIQTCQIWDGRKWKDPDTKWRATAYSNGYLYRPDKTRGSKNFRELLPLKFRLVMNGGTYIYLENAVKNFNPLTTWQTGKTCSSRGKNAPIIKPQTIITSKPTSKPIQRQTSKPTQRPIRSSSSSKAQKIVITNGPAGKTTDLYYIVRFSGIGGCRDKFKNAQIWTGSKFRYADHKWKEGDDGMGFGFKYFGKKFSQMVPIKLRLERNDGTFIGMWNAVKNYKPGASFQTTKTCSSFDPPFDSLNPLETNKPIDPSEFVISFTWQDLAIFGLVCINLVVLALVIRWKCCKSSSQNAKYTTVKMMVDSEDDI